MSESIPSSILAVKNVLAQHPSVIGVILSPNKEQNDDSSHNLFIIVDKNEEISEINSILSNQFPTTFNYVIKSFPDLGYISTSLLQDVFKLGKMIYWSGTADLNASQIFKLRPHSLFTFELAGLPHNEKVQFNYQLYGKKNTGQIKEWEGKRLTKSCFYVPYIHKFKVTRFLSKYAIKHENIDIWI